MYTNAQNVLKVATSTIKIAVWVISYALCCQIGQPFQAPFQLCHLQCFFMPTAFTILVCSSILQAPFCTSCLFIACFAVSHLGDSITSVLLLFIVCLLPHFPQFLRVWGETRPLPLIADLNIHRYLFTLISFHATQKTAWLWWPWIPWRLSSTVIATSVVPTNAAESS